MGFFKKLDRMDEVTNNLDKAISSGNPLEIEKAVSEAELAKQEVAASLQKDIEEDNNMKKNINKNTNTTPKVEVKEPIIKEEVKAEEIIAETKANIVADGVATEEQVNKASETVVVKEQAEVTAKKVNNYKEPTIEELEAIKNAPKEEIKQEEVKTAIKEEVKTDAVEEKLKEIINETPKEEVKTTKNASDNKKVLVPKLWQRVSDDGKQLLNVITFNGEILDYSVGLKYKYRFPNLSAADGLTRIITAKFPKESVEKVTETIEYRGYTIDLEKYGNSAVCRLKDPDGICILEYVSLATVIDILQDELNEGDDCITSWGTIDQVIKFKRGLKSRIKQVDDEDKPVSQRATKAVVPEVKKETEFKKEEVAVDKEKTEMEARIEKAQQEADQKELDALNGVNQEVSK